MEQAVTTGAKPSFTGCGIDLPVNSNERLGQGSMDALLHRPFPCLGRWNGVAGGGSHGGGTTTLPHVTIDH